MTCTATDITEATVGTVSVSEATIGTVECTERSALTNPFVGTGTTGSATDTTGPVISGFRAIKISDTWASFDWDTDEPGTCHINVSTYSDVFPVGGYTSYIHTHYVIGDRVVVVSPLKPATTYYLYAWSTDIYGNKGGSGQKTFKSADTGGYGGSPVQDV